MNDRKKPVKSRYADVIGPNDPNPELGQEGGGFLGERHIARSGREDRDDPRAISGAERTREADEPAAREKADPRA